MEPGETELAVINEIHASAIRDVESLTASFAPFFEQQKEMQDRIAEALAPMTRAAEEIARTMQPMIDDWARMQEMMPSISLPVLPTLSTVLTPYRVEEPIEYIPRPTGPMLVRLDDQSVDTIVSKVVELLKKDASQTLVIPISIVPMPVGATWDHIGVNFTDPHTLRISYKGKLVGAYDYALLGFARKNTKDRLPDKQWGFLLQLAILTEMKGAKPTTRHLSKSLVIKTDACEKSKQNLSKKLQAAFGISDDPFKKYDSIEGYRTKFTLKPEPLLRGDGEVHRSGGSLLDWKEYEDQSDEDLLS